MSTVIHPLTRTLTRGRSLTRSRTSSHDRSLTGSRGRAGSRARGRSAGALVLVGVSTLASAATAAGSVASAEPVSAAPVSSVSPALSVELSSAPGGVATGLTAQALVVEVNTWRAAHGLAPVTWDPELARGSQEWSDHMAATSDLHHAEGGYGGEVLYLTWGHDPETAVAGWINSPAHNDILLGERFTRIGIGIARSADGADYVTGRFS